MKHFIKHLFKLYLIVMFLQLGSVSIHAEPKLTVDGFEWDHVMNQDIIPETSNSFSVGSTAFPVADVHVGSTLFFETNEVESTGPAIDELTYNGIALEQPIYSKSSSISFTVSAGGAVIIEGMFFSNMPSQTVKYEFSCDFNPTTVNDKWQFLAKANDTTSDLHRRKLLLENNSGRRDFSMTGVFEVGDGTGGATNTFDIRINRTAGSGSMTIIGRNLILTTVPDVRSTF